MQGESISYEKGNCWIDNTDPTGHYTQGKVLSYVKGQKQSYDSDAWELQQDLIKLGHMKREDIPAGEEGYYGPRTVSAVNEFKNIYLPGGNKGSNEGKVGDTTWLYIKRQVKLKNLEGPTNPEYLAKRKAEIWDEFYTDYDKLTSKSKSSSSTSGNTHDYGKSVSNQGTGNGRIPGVNIDKVDPVEFNLRLAEVALAEKYKKYIETGEVQDITDILNTLSERNVKIAKKHRGDNFKDQIIWWINMVGTNRPWDLKSRVVEVEIGAEKLEVRIWNQPYLYKGPNDEKAVQRREDDFGNIHYGYVGRALFDSDAFLKIGAGGAQYLSDSKNLPPFNPFSEFKTPGDKFVNSILNGDWGDNPGDAETIQIGIDAYHKQHPFGF